MFLPIMVMLLVMLSATKFLNHYCLMYHGSVCYPNTFLHTIQLCHAHVFRITSTINSNKLQSCVDLGNSNGRSYKYECLLRSLTFLFASMFQVKKLSIIICLWIITARIDKTIFLKACWSFDSKWVPMSQMKAWQLA